ncbi:hypothetical protein GCM10023225_10840 [Kineococcus glutinatus]|uniref:Uncharacterized protein n=1 Tax=Kineococcus glutinatus TaxID=1070872 RepID=A0ABP9HHB0_9ACTN
MLELHDGPQLAVQVQHDAVLQVVGRSHVVFQSVRSGALEVICPAGRSPPGPGCPGRVSAAVATARGRALQSSHHHRSGRDPREGGTTARARREAAALGRTDDAVPPDGWAGLLGGAGGPDVTGVRTTTARGGNR